MTWSEESRLSDDTGRDREPAVARASIDRIVVAWQHNTTTEDGRQINYTYSDDAGQTWTGPTRLDDPSEIQEVHQPDPAADAGNNVLATFVGYSSTTDRWGLHYISSADNGATWGAVAFLQDGHQPSIDAATGGQWVLSWSQGRCFDHPRWGYL